MTEAKQTTTRSETKLIVFSKVMKGCTLLQISSSQNNNENDCSFKENKIK